MPTAGALLESAKQAFVAKDFAEAERLCRLIIANAPALAGPWIILGDIELRQRRPDAALAWANRAIALEPRNAYGYLVCCKSLVAVSRLEEAFETATAAIRDKDCPAAALDAFGLIFSQLGRYAYVLEVFRRAVTAEPGNVGYRFNLAVAERTFGHMEQSEVYCDQVIAQNPHFYVAYFIRADLRKQTPDRNHVAEMEKLLTADAHNARGEVMMRFALAKECEDLGDYVRAFRHLKAGADLQRQSLKYDVKGNIAVMNRITKAHTSEYLDRVARNVTNDKASRDNPIFIVGLPRSGTTLIERIVTSHSKTVAAGELSTMPNELTRAAREAGITRGGEWVERLDTIDLAAVGNAYSRVARETGIPDRQRLTDKYPANFLYCGAIRATFPNARIIALKRRPMDSCYALYKQLFADGVYPYSYSFDELAQYYASYSRLIAHWNAALPAEQFLEVSYEGIVADLEGQSRRIMNFLGLPWEDAILKFHESDAPVTTASAAQVRQPIYASSVGKWKNYAEELAPLRAKLEELMPPGEMID